MVLLASITRNPHHLDTIMYFWIDYENHKIFWQEVTVGPSNRTAISNDKFLRANLIGDYVGYTNIPSFDDYYLVIPRQVCFVAL